MSLIKKVLIVSKTTRLERITSKGIDLHAAST
jgi:hypothetical protein